jgi:hypothetical protein
MNRAACRLPCVAFGALVIVMACAGNGRGDIYSPADSGRSATATFSLSSGELILTLKNTDTTNAPEPPNETFVLTGVFFNLPGTLTTPSNFHTGTDTQATVTSGSVFNLGTATVATTTTNVSGAWAYRDNNPISGFKYGVGAAGLSPSGGGTGIFGTGDLFNTTVIPGNGDVGSPPDGVGFGIVSSGMNTFDLDGFKNGNYALIKDTVTFDLGAYTGALPTGDVEFVYGTAFDAAVPSPSSAVALCGGAAMIGLLGGFGWRRRSLASVV